MKGIVDTSYLVVEDYGCDICCERTKEDDVNWFNGCDVGLCNDCANKLNHEDGENLHNGENVKEILEKYQSL